MSVHNVKYDLGSNKVAPGYVKITANTIYNDQLGFGIDPQTPVKSGVVGKEPIIDDFLYADNFFRFKQKLTPGNYHVKLIFADTVLNSINVGAENVITEAPNSEAYFNNPIFKGAVIFNGKSELEFNVAVVNGILDLDFKEFKFDHRRFKAMVNAIEITTLPKVEVNTIPKIHIAGDSTVANYASDDLQAGWGEMLGKYLGDSFQVSNKAIGGRSTRSFYRDGRLDEILLSMKPGDYILIQFGHNDGSLEKEERYTSPSDYQRLLRDYYIEGARQRGAIPILVTPVPRHGLESKSRDLTYVNAVKEIADKSGTMLIDLHNIALAHYNSLAEKTVEKLKQLDQYYITTKKGGSDYTHFTKQGADKIAKLVYEQLQKLGVSS